MHIEAKNIFHHFGTDSGDVSVLKDLSFSVANGSFVALVGPSGCGKSTITRLLSGLMQPVKGEIYISGERVVNPRSSIGMAFQNPVLLEWRNVSDNITLPLEIVAKSSPIKKRKIRAQELLELVGLTEFATNRPSELSGGMKQRVSLCRALVHKPELLILDEPFGALDAFTKEDLWQTMHELKRKENFTCILITHDLREAIFLADEIIVLTGRPASIQYKVKVNLGKNRKIDDLYSTKTAKTLAILRKQIEIGQSM